MYKYYTYAQASKFTKYKRKIVLSSCVTSVLLTCIVANVPAISSFSLNAVSPSFSASSFSANSLLRSLNVFTSTGTSDLVFAFIPCLSRDSMPSKDDCSDQKGIQYRIHTAYQCQSVSHLVQTLGQDKYTLYSLYSLMYACIKVCSCGSSEHRNSGWSIQQHEAVT